MSDDASTRTCPECGREYAYRVPSRMADSFGVSTEYRCRPRQHPYVYFHEIPRKQAVDVAYAPGESGVPR